VEGRLARRLTISSRFIRASVELLSPAHTGTYLSQNVTQLQPFRG
jgi:hypothetical protein